MSDLEHLESLSDEFFGITKSHKQTPDAGAGQTTGRQRANSIPRWKRALRAHQSNKKRKVDNALIDDAMRKRVAATSDHT